MKTANLSKTRMAYVEEGDGIPVLLVHGFPLDHTMWDPQIAALAPHARVIAPDLRGFGATPPAAGDAERGVSMEDHANDLNELLDALGIREPIVLAGLSMGGYVAWQFVRQHGHRLRALVLCDTRAKADTEEARAGRLKMAEAVAKEGARLAADAMEPKLFRKAAFDKQPEVVAAIRATMLRQTPAAIAAAQRGMAVRPDVTEMLPHITVPTLVLVGVEDAIATPAEMKQIADAIPGAEYVVIPESGHMTTVENPAATNAALVKFVGAATLPYDRLATEH
ncbi:MAG: alpha/beta fold hydrolase [Pirellulales bacterium]